jgi:cytochrome c1
MTPMQPTQFNWVLFWLGLAALLFVVVDLVRRGPRQHPLEPVWQVAGAVPERGPEAIVRYGCNGCHDIPSVRTARGRVGPQLGDIREQTYVAGVLPNTPENLVLWIRDPQGVNPRTAMPNLGVTEAEARDIAAYLYGAR